jgi:outer membrane protein OmpA-like peptidoglycan-associated protein
MGIQFRKVVAGASALILGVSIVVLGASPGHADPRGNPKDSTLTMLALPGVGMTALAPSFVSSTHQYQVVSYDDESAGLIAMPTVSAAAVVVTVGTATIPRIMGVATVPLNRGRNDISIAVTSTDQSSTTTYHLVVWRHVAPTPGIASLPPIVTLPYGGQRFDVLLSDGALPVDCNRRFQVRGDYQDEQGTTTFDPKTGLTDAVGMTPALTDRSPGKADLTIITSCNPPGGGFTSTVTARNAVTVLDKVTVTSSEIPATVTEASVFRVFGPGISYNSRLAGWLEDADGEQYGLSRWGWTGPNQTEWYLDYTYDETFFMKARQLTFHVGHNDSKGRKGRDAISDFAKTVNFVPPAPTVLSLSPASGPLAGGSTFLIRGRFLSSSIEYLTVKVGGVEADTSSRSSANSDSSNYHAYLTGLDTIEVTVPPGLTPGLVPVTVSTEYGETVAATRFRYSARPRIDSISPVSVAQTGGSVVTLTGTDFGTAGVPSVVIGGVKSPLVTRVSANQVTAVVPSSTVAGTVAVALVSPQGGGVSPAVDLTLVAPSTLPTITRVSPAAATAGYSVTVTGTDFGPAGTVAVGVGDAWAIPTSSSSTALRFAIPAASTAGLRNVSVGTPTGLTTMSNALRVLPAAGITTVAPNTMPSYATGAAGQITISGAGFGTTGTVQVGSAAAVAYTATLSGTRIGGVAVPRVKTGVLPVVVTPKGAKTPLRSTVRVSGPAIAYVGPDPYAVQYDVNDVDNDPSGNMIYQVETPGGSPSRIQGTGFGRGGVLAVGGRVVRISSWSDTAITFTAPAHVAGPVAVSVTPANSTISATRAVGINYIPAIASQPTIEQIASVADNGYANRTDFDPVADASAAFTLAGQFLAGTNAAATRVVISDGTPQSFTLTPTAVTATKLTFNAPRSFTATGEWKAVRVLTNLGEFLVDRGVFYRSVETQVSIAPSTGYCGKTAVTASGNVTYSSATVTITASAPAFGDAGTVRLDGVTVGTTSWTDSEIVLDLANLATPLTNLWGPKTFVVTPDDTSKAPRSVGFTCGVTPSVATTANGSVDPLTVTAGTSFTMGSNSAGFLGSFSVTAPGGYEYVTDDDFNWNAFDHNVHTGVPSAAGDYWVRVAVPQATYDRDPYLPFTAAPVHVIITGQAVTITAVSDNGPSLVYKGRLVAGTSSGGGDFHYTATSTADPITKVTYEHRDVICEGQGDNAGWIDGLPGNVAISDQGCGGDGTSHSSWQVRVKSFEMTAGGTDRAGYYLPTFEIASIDITPKPLTVDSVRADKVWDGTDAAPLGDLTVTGAVDGDTVELVDDAAGTFADAAVGEDKPVTLAQNLTLDGAAAGNYELTNPQPTIVGTISKAKAHLALAASTSTVLVGQTTPVTVAATVTDAVTDNAPPSTADLAPVVLVSQTPLICEVTGTTVTPLAAGVCVIAGTEAASANYEAATAVSDPASTTETVEIQVFGAPQTISVLADDLTVAEGDTVEPTVQISGLFQGDSINSVDYDYYSGNTLLTAVPTDVGTYKVVPKGGTLEAATTLVYNNPASFNYVAGTLVITPVPASITVIEPRMGPISGGNTVTITGAGLDDVRTIKIGAGTLTGGDFAVNADGTELTFVVPAVRTPGPVDLLLIAGSATTSDVYTYLPVVPWAPRNLDVSTGSSSLTLTFAEPASDGGSPIIGYHISLTGGRTWVTRADPCDHGVCTVTLNGLAGLRAYAVSVRALNDVGAGPWSAVQNVFTNAEWHPTFPAPAGGQVPVPANPTAYQGPRRYTKALYSTYAGKPAAPISSLGKHQMVAGDAVTTLRGELFAFDSAKLTAAGRAAVRTVAQHLRLARRVTCEGYTDYAADAAHEQALSAARARIICQTLIADGADVTVTSRGYGGARPVVVGGTAQSRAENRRVVIRVDS